MDKDTPEICMIRIIFPSTSDDSSIAYKKKIAELLKDEKDVNIQFSIANNMPPPNMPMR